MGKKKIIPKLSLYPFLISNTGKINLLNLEKLQ